MGVGTARVIGKAYACTSSRRDTREGCREVEPCYGLRDLVTSSYDRISLELCTIKLPPNVPSDEYGRL